MIALWPGKGTPPRRGELGTANPLLIRGAQERCLVRHRLANASLGPQPKTETGIPAMIATREGAPTVVNAHTPRGPSRRRTIHQLPRLASHGGQTRDSEARFRLWPLAWQPSFRTIHLDRARGVQPFRPTSPRGLASAPCPRPLRRAHLLLGRPLGARGERNQEPTLGMQVSARFPMEPPHFPLRYQAHFPGPARWRNPCQAL